MEDDARDVLRSLSVSPRNLTSIRSKYSRRRASVAHLSLYRVASSVRERVRS